MCDFRVIFPGQTARKESALCAEPENYRPSHKKTRNLAEYVLLAGDDTRPLIIHPAELAIIIESRLARLTPGYFSDVGTRFIDYRVCLAMNNFAARRKRRVIGSMEEERRDPGPQVAPLSAASIPVDIQRRENNFPTRHTTPRAYN